MTRNPIPRNWSRQHITSALDWILFGVSFGVACVVVMAL